MNVSNMPQLKLSVILVTFNSRAVILECLESIASSISESLEVIVVDNASSDDTVDLIRQRFPEVRIVDAGSNLGFGKGVRLGTAHATGDVFCLLNPDAVAELRVLTHLAESVRQDESIGIIAPLISQPHGRLKVVSAGSMPTAWRMFTHYSGLSRFAKFAPRLSGHYLMPNQLDSIQDVDWVTGACLLIRAETWSNIGGISERWFMYAEDIELCHRVQQYGLRVVLNSQYGVTHLVGASAGEITGPIRSDWITNLYDFYQTDLSSGKSSELWWRTVVVGGLFSRALMFAMRGRILHSTEWTRESVKFVVYARAVATISSHRARAASRMTRGKK